MESLGKEITVTVIGTHTLSTTANDDLRESVAGLARAARDAGSTGAPVQVSIGGQRANVPPEVADALAETLTALTHRGGVIIGAVDEDVTTDQAARMARRLAHLRLPPRG